MKKLLLLFLVGALACGCFNSKATLEPGDLEYPTVTTNFPSLHSKVTLTGDVAHQRLLQQLVLTNTGDKQVHIDEIAVATPEGIRSRAVKDNAAPFDLAPGKDTTLTLEYMPVNNLKFYRLTNLPGSFTEVYNTAITYIIGSAIQINTANIRCRAGNSEYLAYMHKYGTPAVGYSFNTKTQFNSREMAYLDSAMKSARPPFALLSDQEIAVAGLNFRFNIYSRQDTMHADITIVNHAEFPVKFVPAELNIMAGNSPVGTKVISIDKISGDQQRKTMLENGDRVLIHFKKIMKAKSATSPILTLQLNKAFILSGGKPLFYGDMQLLPFFEDAKKRAPWGVEGIL